MAQSGIRAQLWPIRSDQARLVGLIGAEVWLVIGLHALSRDDAFAIGWSDLPGRLRAPVFEEAIASVLLLIALGLAYWLLLSTLAYLAASCVGRPAVVGSVRWLTLPPIRRLVSRAIALSLAATAFAVPLAPAVANLAGGGSASAAMVAVDRAGQLHPPDGDNTAADGPLEVIVPPHLRVPPAPDSTDDNEGTAEPPTPSPEGAVAYTMTVRRGDHLWNLSERHLQRVWNRMSLGEHEIARYWVRVIEENLGSIRSGDPDLIYPGEVITLPIVEP